MLTVALALIYYIGLGTLVSLSRQGKLSPALAVWLPDIVFAIFGLAMLTRLEKLGDRDIVGRILGFFRGLNQILRSSAHNALSIASRQKYCWAGFLWFLKSSIAMCSLVSCFIS